MTAPTEHLKRYMVRRLQIRGRQPAYNRLITIDMLTGRILADEPFVTETHSTTYASAIQADENLTITDSQPKIQSISGSYCVNGIKQG